MKWSLSWEAEFKSEFLIDKKEFVIGKALNVIEVSNIESFQTFCFSKSIALYSVLPEKNPQMKKTKEGGSIIVKGSVL